MEGNDILAVCILERELSWGKLEKGQNTQVGPWLEECSILGNHGCVTAAVRVLTHNNFNTTCLCNLLLKSCVFLWQASNLQNALCNTELKVESSEDQCNVLHVRCLVAAVVCIVTVHVSALKYANL